MKIKLSAIALCASIACSMNAQAGILTWNATGGNGTWDTAASNWSNGVTNVQWPSTLAGTDDDAVFGNTVGTVTIAGGGIIANDITFNTAGYTITGGNLTLNGDTNNLITANQSASINSNIIGSATVLSAASGKILTLGGSINGSAANTTLTLQGAGSTVFNGSIGSSIGNVLFTSGTGTTATFTAENTFAGQLWLGNGGVSSTVNFSNGNQLGSGSGNNFIAIQNGSTLRYTGSGDTSTVNERIFYVNSGNGTVDVQQSTGVFNIKKGTLASSISGVGTFFKTGAGELRIVTSVVNDILNKAVNIQDGTLTLGTTGAGVWVTNSAISGSATSTLHLENGSLLGSNFTNNMAGFQGKLQIDAGATFQSRNVDIYARSLVGGGDVAQGWTTATRVLRITHGDTADFSGVIHGNGSSAVEGNNERGVLSVIKTGVGTQTLSGVNTYAGNTTVENGTLALSGAGSIANSVTIDVQVGATIDVSGTDAIFKLNNGQNLTGAGTIVGPIQLAIGSTSNLGSMTQTRTALMLVGGDSLGIELNGDNQTVGGGINDLITNVSDLTLDGTLNLTEATSFAGNAVAGDRWVLIEYTGVLTDNGLVLGATPTLDPGLFYELDLATVGELGLLVSAIPEPSTALLMALGGLALMVRRKRA